MFKLFRYLGEHKAAVLAVIVLLIVQAYCDLSLPSYTSDIVDVGIQQKGIAYAVPEVMRADTMGYLALLLEEEEAEKAASFYVLSEDGNYKITVGDKEALAELEEIISLPMIMLSKMSESEEMTPETLKAMFDSGMVTKEQILEIRQKAALQMADLSESMKKQMAVLAVENEYAACAQLSYIPTR